MADGSYIFSPHTANDIERFRRWAERRTIKAAERRIELLDRHKVTSPFEKRRLIDEAIASIDSGNAERAAGETFGGVRLLLYLSLRKRHPDVTLRRAGELVRVTGLRQVQAMLDEANGLVATPPLPPGEPEPVFAPEQPAPTPVAPGELLADQEDRRRSIFNAMCASKGMTPAGLAELPIEEAERLFLEVTGLKAVDRLKLRNRLIKFAEAAKPAGE